jgi:hypothetical protein
MENRKYSTGTKGRLKMHSDRCKESIRSHSPNFSLATEFIASIDPDHEDTVWQRFQTPEDVIPELDQWLNGGDTTPPPPRVSPVPTEILKKTSIKPASQLVSPKRESAIEKVRDWLHSPEGTSTITPLSPLQAAELILEKIHSEVGNP